MPPDAQPAALPDQLLYSSSKVVHLDMHSVVRLAGRLDPERLQKATMALLQAQPILAMRFVPGPWTARWDHAPATGADAAFRLVHAGGDDRLLFDFITAPADPRTGPQVHVRLFRPADPDQPTRADTLCVKVGHVAADAFSVAECTYLLASLYTDLGNGPTGRAPAVGNRELAAIYDRLTPLEVASIAGRVGLEHARNLASGPWSFPSHMGPALRPTLLTLHLGENRVRPLVAIAGANHATLNDAVLAAYVRALAELHPLPHRPRLRLQTTVNLRRYLPGGTQADCVGGAPVANLSGWAYPDMGFDPGAAFSDTVALVRDEMRRLKAGPLGLGDWLWYALPFNLLPFAVARRLVGGMARPMLRAILAHPTFTNMGALEPSRAVFGHTGATQAFLTVPIMRPPFVFLGVSGFGHSLTLTAGFYEPAVDRRRVQRLLDAIERELPRGSNPPPIETHLGGST